MHEEEHPEVTDNVWWGKAPQGKGWKSPAIGKGPLSPLSTKTFEPYLELFETSFDCPVHLKFRNSFDFHNVYSNEAVSKWKIRVKIRRLGREALST